MELLLAHALAPARQRGTIEGQPVLKEFRAAEYWKYGSPPTIEQHSSDEIVHVLQDHQPSHQPGRQRRMAGPS